jgi:hypothetical protein
MLIDQEGWKISLLKGMYVAGLPTLIKAIWLKGSQLTYVAKKFMSLVVLTKQGSQMNWVAIMFNNLYIQLQDLFTLTKPKASRENTKIWCCPNHGHHVLDLVFGRPNLHNTEF